MRPALGIRTGPVGGVGQPVVGGLPEPRRRGTWTWLEPVGRSGLAVLAGLLALALAALVIYPMCSILVHLFVQDGHVNFGAFTSTFAIPGLASAIGTTAEIVGISIVLALAIGTFFAWCNERTDATIPLLSDLLPLIPFLMPLIAGTIGWVFLLAPGSGFVNVAIRGALSGAFGVHLQQGPLNIYSTYGLVFIYTITLVPFAYLAMAAGMRHLDSSCEEASRISGAGPIRTFFRTTLPGVVPSIGTALVLMLIIGLGDFAAPEVIGVTAQKTFVVSLIYNAMNVTFPPKEGEAAVLSFFMMFVIGLTFVVSRYLSNRRPRTELGARGATVVKTKLGRWRPVVRGVMSVYVFGVSVLPFAGLLFVSLQPYWTDSVQWGQLNLASYGQVFTGNIGTASALEHSFVLAAIGATVIVLVVMITLKGLERAGRAVTWLVATVLRLPAGFSGVLIAVGFILAFAGAPFHLGDTLEILLLAYLVIYLPFGVFILATGLGQIGLPLTEASSISGATQWRTFAKITLPLMVPSILAAWTMIFVLISGDLTASAMLASPSTTVVGFELLDQYTSGGYPVVAALAVLITLLCVVVVVASRRILRSSLPVR